MKFKGEVELDKIIDGLGKADWTVLLTILIGLVAWGITKFFDYRKVMKKIDKLEKIISDKDEELRGEISAKHKNLGEDISQKHVGLGSNVQGRYRNLGEKISSEHMTIKEDTRNVYDMMLTEKQNREILYNNNIHGKEILEKLDFIRETVDQNAQLTQEVYALKTENQKLFQEKKNNLAIEEFSSILRSFENKLSEFEAFGETDEIRVYLKKIQKELSQYVD